MNKHHGVLRWIIWGLSVLFLFYEFFLRVFPTVMVDNLMKAFSVDAAALGTLSAFYFYSYAPMQIPVGVLMDRFGARKLLTFASLICAIGAFLFALANQIGIAELGRFFMGIGSAFAFVGMIYISSHWFSGKQLALLVGLGNSIGMLGAVGGEGPLGYIVENYGWRLTLFGLGVVGVLLAIIIFLCIRQEMPASIRKAEAQKASHDLLHNLKIVSKNKNTWVNAASALLFYATTAAFASLWGIPFLEKTYLFSKEEAGFATSMIFVGWIVGGPIIGYISDHFQRRKRITLLGIALAAAALLPVIYITTLSAPLLFFLLFLVGLFSSAQLLNFSIAIELHPRIAKGTAIALTNCIIAIGSAILQPLVGYLLDLRSSGVPSYSIADFQFAFTIFPLTFLAAFILLFFVKVGKSQKSKV
ncbi:MAG: MFS transporter [Simkaniaceae bacterium]|nr:MFS transporter [Simkaniaceae bacterium]